jgi:hypothetical protein
MVSLSKSLAPCAGEIKIFAVMCVALSTILASTNVRAEFTYAERAQSDWASPQSRYAVHDGAPVVSLAPTEAKDSDFMIEPAPGLGVGQGSGLNLLWLPGFSTNVRPGYIKVRTKPFGETDYATKLFDRFDNCDDLYKKRPYVMGLRARVEW